MAKLFLEAQTIANTLNFTASEAYNIIRTNLTLSMHGKERGKSIGFVSAEPREGKSYTSINVAYALAKDGYKTIIVSADLRKPTIGKKLKIKFDLGLSDVLCGKAQLQDVIQSAQVHENLFVLPAGTLPPNPSELLGSDEMKKVDQILTEEYDYIIYDFPPVNQVVDAIAASRLLDGMILVVRSNYSQKKLVRKAISALNLAGVKILGFVVNDSSADHHYYKKYRHYKHYNTYDTSANAPTQEQENK